MEKLLGSLPYFDVGVDLGCGCGLRGPLLKRRVRWLVGVDHRAVSLSWAILDGYDEVAKCNVLEYKVSKGCGLVTLFDVVEHFTKEEGRSLLEGLRKQYVVSTTPSQFFPWAENGHKSLWKPEELEKLGFTVTLHDIGFWGLLYGKEILAVRCPR